MIVSSSAIRMRIGRSRYRAGSPLGVDRDPRRTSEQHAREEPGDDVAEPCTAAKRA